MSQIERSMATSDTYDGCFFGDGQQQPTNWKRGEIVFSSRITIVSHVIDTNHLMEIRCVAKQATISDDVGRDQRNQLDVEILALRTLKHPKIVAYLGYSRTSGLLSLFIPYMEKGTLSKFICSKDAGHLSEKETASFTGQILEGLEYLHRKKIIHRDIKGSNILMEDDQNIKIADFGVCKILSTLSCATAQEVGTINWMAPELFLDVPHTTKVDIWSLGCTVYQMITGKIPFNEIPQRLILSKAYQNTLELTFPEHLSSCFKRFMQLACKKDPKERPTATQLLQFVFADSAKMPMIECEVWFPKGTVLQHPMWQMYCFVKDKKAELMAIGGLTRCREEDMYLEIELPDGRCRVMDDAMSLDYYKDDISRASRIHLKIDLLNLQI